MEIEYLQVTLALILVIFLILLASFFLKSFKNSLYKKMSHSNNIKILDSIVIDNQRKILSISHKDMEYLIMSGENSNLLLDTFHSEVNNTKDS